ncbi:MAG TPA: ATP-binding cassette domain-containing protein [Candidatus Baltobacteraceae bacterium]|nr:ATP-binding cassette domain-containing protein [Candidatus Baltobacteraceae bacterium]
MIRFQAAGVSTRGAVLLEGVDWTVRAGERWVVVGPNGAGKTTLVRVAAGYLYPTRGRVELLGEVLGETDIRALRSRIGYMSAALRGLVRDDLRALDVVATAAAGALDPFWTRGRDDRARDTARTLLERFGAGGLADRTMGSLSSGEQQRVQLARALLPDPDLLLLDEPFAGLDLGARVELLAALGSLARETRPTGIVLVVHHLEEIPAGFDHALVLARARVTAQGRRADVLTDAILSDAYGLRLRVRRDGDGGLRVRPA